MVPGPRIAECVNWVYCTTVCMNAALPPPPASRYTFECITSALMHLHVNGLVHHDLKARNMVRFYDGRFRLIDFDQARLAGKQDMGSTSIEICPPEVGRDKHVISK